MTSDDFVQIFLMLMAIAGRKIDADAIMSASEFVDAMQSMGML